MSSTILATAKIGLSLVVAVGPLMILGLLFQSTPSTSPSG